VANEVTSVPASKGHELQVTVYAISKTMIAT
jgi:hypothetical protein